MSGAARLAEILAEAQNRFLARAFSPARDLCTQAVADFAGEAQLWQAWHLLALAEKALGHLTAAQQALEQAILLQPAATESRNNLGNLLLAQGRYEQAIDQFRQALSLAPENYAAALNLGNAFARLGDTEQAIAYYDQALAIQPQSAEAQWGRALAYLLQGDLARGWEGYEWRFQFQQAYPHRYTKPYWDGREFRGQRLLIYDEIGYGDVFQFARYLPLVKALGGSVLFEVKPGLLPLMRSLAGVDHCYERGAQPVGEADFDMHFPLESLPGLFGTTLQNIPQTVPYLFADPLRCAHWAAEFASNARLKIGIVWAGNPDSAYDAGRSCPLTLWAALLRTPDCHFYSLQVGAAQQQLQALPLSLSALGDKLYGFGETAAAVTHLDLIITVETALAHLAGAMGKPTWVLLSKVPAWRWLRERSDTPWYPTMRLFRQTTAGDWASVLTAVEQALAQYAKVRG